MHCVSKGPITVRSLLSFRRENDAPLVALVSSDGNHALDELR